MLHRALLLALGLQIALLAACTSAPSPQATPGVTEVAEATPFSSPAAAVSPTALLTEPAAIPPTAVMPAETDVPTPTASQPAPAAAPTQWATPLPAEMLPEPFTILNSSGAAEVYLVVDGARRHIVDWPTFLALGFQQRDIVTSWQVGTMQDGPPITRLLKGSGDPVYWMEAGLRRHIPDMDTFRQLGYKEADISVVPDRLLRAWPVGQPLPSVLASPGTTPEPVPPPSTERRALAYHPLDPNGGSRLVELFTVYTDGHNPTRLSYHHGQAESMEPAWAPDGQSIAFTGCSDGSSGSCAVRITGLGAWNPIQISPLLTHGPSWSPALPGSPVGAQIAFWSSQTMTLYTVDIVKTDQGLAGGTVRPLGPGRDPAWTPDGRIAFWTGGPDTYRLMVMDAGGGNVHPVDTAITVLDQSYSPWRETRWLASGSPFNPEGR